MIQIIVADDHPLIRNGLKQTFADLPDMCVSGEADDGDTLIQKVFNNTYDVVILDISMPGPNVIDIIKKIKNHFPTLPMLILSMHNEVHYATRLIHAGASGYITKGTPPEELIIAIRRIHDGKKYVSPDLLEEMAHTLEVETPLHTKLSDREYEYLCLLGKGLCNKEIMEKMGIQDSTISTYRRRALSKLNLKSTAEMIAYAIRNKLPAPIYDETAPPPYDNDDEDEDVAANQHPSEDPVNRHKTVSRAAGEIFFTTARPIPASNTK